MRCARPGCAGEINDSSCNECGIWPAPSRSTDTQVLGAEPVPPVEPPSNAGRSPGGGTPATTTAPLRIGPGADTSGAGSGSPDSRHGGPLHPRGSPVLCRLQPGGRPQPRGRPGPHGGVLRQVPSSVLVLGQAAAGRAGRRPVRGGRPHRPRRPRMDLRGPRPQGRRPLGRSQGSDQPRRHGRHGRRAGRAAVPGRGRAPQHRQDLQLRRARR